MSIFLMILKILLFTIIALLGLLLLVLLIVLFVPIHYKVAGVVNDEVKAGEFGIRWLILHAKGSYDKENGLKLRAKILFFTVFSNDKEKTKKSKGKDNEDNPDNDVKNKKSKKNKKTKKNKQNSDPLADDGITPDMEKAMEESSLGEDNTDMTAAESLVSDGLEKTVDESSVSDGLENTVDKSAVSDQEKLDSLDDTVIDFSDDSLKQSDQAVDKAFDKAGELLDKIKNKAEAIEKKQDHFDQFINKDFTKRTIKNAMKFIAKTLKAISPRRGYAYIKMGLKSAADTGIWLGRIATFYPIYGKWLKIEPDFYNKVFNLDMKCRGHIMIGPTAFRGLFLYLKKDTKRTLSLLKKI